MKVDVCSWTISDLVKFKGKIDEQPPYQRGEVWTRSKKKHLIDSILRGIDIPKIYLRKINRGPFEFEVADGQQRVSAILQFLANRIKLDVSIINGLDLGKVDEYFVGGKKFTELNSTLQDRINNYKLTIAIVEDATNDEIRTLFGRLQLGSTLNPAEKRNAIISTVGDQINNFALNHACFSKSKIPASRYKRQDYIAHGIALAKYANKEDLKAELLLKLYTDQSIFLKPDDLKKIDIVLDNIKSVDELSDVKIINKFTFIDFFWFFYRNYSKNEAISFENIAAIFSEFDRKRLYFHKNGSEQLISKNPPTVYDQNLYKYIDGFHNAGYEVSKINNRAEVFDFLFLKFIK